MYIGYHCLLDLISIYKEKTTGRYAIMSRQYLKHVCYFNTIAKKCHGEKIINNMSKMEFERNTSLKGKECSALDNIYVKEPTHQIENSTT